MVITPPEVDATSSDDHLLSYEDELANKRPKLFESILSTATTTTNATPSLPLSPSPPTTRPQQPSSKPATPTPTPPPAAAAAELKRPATKLKALLEALETIRASDDKVVIFSQFTSYLDLVEMALAQHGWLNVRLDGTMSMDARSETLATFNTNPQYRVICISLHAGGVGINLTAANRVFLMDLWWNTAVEQQAVDRIHRIGQTKRVYITRFVVEKTVEDRILDIQTEKDLIVDRTLSNHRGDKAPTTGLTLVQLRRLFTSSL